MELKSTRNRSDFHLSWPKRYLDTVLFQAERVEVSVHRNLKGRNGVELRDWIVGTECCQQSRLITSPDAWGLDGADVFNTEMLFWQTVGEGWGTVTDIVIWACLADRTLATLVRLKEPKWLNPTNSLQFAAGAIRIPADIWSEVVWDARDAVVVEVAPCN